MSAPSLYRRHRPRTFEDVVGQDHVVRTLRNAVEQGKVHHAYLFVGSRGTGKTSMAKILASCLDCEHGPTVTPCGECESCLSIQRATSLDVVEMDAASNNSVDDMRELRDRVQTAPSGGRWRVYILDEAHMLTTQAWNALLKTLEEPPPQTVFVLATTEAHKVLPTVVDRTHRFDFTRPTGEQISRVLARVAEREQLTVTEGALGLVARHANGSFRDALGTLEQLVTYAGQTVTEDDAVTVLGIGDDAQVFGAVDAVIDRDPGLVLRTVQDVASHGRDLGSYARELERHARDLLVCCILGGVPPEVRLTADRDAQLDAQARRIGRDQATHLLELLADALTASRDGADGRAMLELALVKAADPNVDPTLRALQTRLARIEQHLSGGGALPAPAAPQAAPPQAQAESPQGAPPAPPAAPPAGSVSEAESAQAAPPAPAAPQAPAAGAEHAAPPRPHVVDAPSDHSPLQAVPPAGEPTPTPLREVPAPQQQPTEHQPPQHDAGPPAPAAAPSPAYGTPPQPREPERNSPAYGTPPQEPTPQQSEAPSPAYGTPPQSSTPPAAAPAAQTPPPAAPTPPAAQTPPAAPAPPPAPAEASAPPAPAAPGLGPSIDDVIAVWGGVLDNLRGRDQLCAVALERARPVELEGGELCIAFPTDAAFYRGTADREERRFALREALRDVTGSPLTVRFELRDLVAPVEVAPLDAPPPPAPAQAPAPQYDPLTQHAAPAHAAPSSPHAPAAPGASTPPAQQPPSAPPAPAPVAPLGSTATLDENAVVAHLVTEFDAEELQPPDQEQN